ncbi:hypothetical protein DYB36_009112 [Aphanomyces astaci]|uniref:Cyclic nucleotide-binding domain-containing protein n=1 Tax=Aphanomyces astaci TaxID=112090 RepID=A0A397BIU7_APHAT|nr:hypothetical protein DYB36_009112 [Aphanomyces astaci]
MARSVGVTAGVVTQLVVNGKVLQKGILAPTTPDIYEPALEALAKEGITFVEKVTCLVPVSTVVVPSRRKSSQGSYKGRNLIGSDLSSRSFTVKTSWGLVARAKSIDPSFKAADSLRKRVAKLESELGGQKGPVSNDIQPPSRAAGRQENSWRRSSVSGADEIADASSWLPTIHHTSTVLRVWHVTLAFVIFYQMIYIPFNMGFNPNIQGTPWQTVDRVTDMLFVMDILVNFNVAFYESFPEDDQRHILLRYSTDRAAKDKFPAFPVDWMGNSMSGGNEGVNYLGMIRILRTPRLAGIFRVLKFLKNTGEFMWWLFQHSKGSIVMRFLRTMQSVMIAITLCIVLVVACSCYYAMMMVVMGQDIVPVYEYEMAYLSTASIVGAIVIAPVFGNVSILVESLTSDSDTYYDKMEGTRAFPMNSSSAPEVVQEIVLNLETRIYMPEDYVVSAGEMGMEMYGRLEIALMMDCRRTASVRARSFCVLGVLDRAHFSSILSRFKDDRVKLEAIIMNKYDNDIYRPQVIRKSSVTANTLSRMGSTGGGSGIGTNKVALRMLYEATSCLHDVSGRVTKLEASMAKLTEAMVVLRQRPAIARTLVSMELLCGRSAPFGATNALPHVNLSSLALKVCEAVLLQELTVLFKDGETSYLALMSELLRS